MLGRSVNLTTLFLGRLNTKKSDIRQSHWLGLVIIYLHYQKLSKYSKLFKSYSPYSASENFASLRLFTSTPHDPDFVFLLAIVKMNIYTKFHKDSIENVAPRMKNRFSYLFDPVTLFLTPCDRISNSSKILCQLTI